MKSSVGLFTILFALVIVYILPCYGQRLPLRIYSVKEGLPQSQVQTILQDQLGYIWIGTADGLARFNGRTFTIFTQKHGLGSNYMQAGLVDAKGDIWISHRTKGLSKIDGQTNEIEVIREPKEIANTRINDIYQDTFGIYWFATVDKGLFTYNGRDWSRLCTDDGLVDNGVNAICEQKNGYLWFATNQGISVFKRTAQEIEYVLSISQKDGLPANQISCIISDKNDDIWIGTDKNGICSIKVSGLDISDWCFTRYTTMDGLSSNKIQVLYEDKSGRIWIGSKNNGVTIFKPASSQLRCAEFSTLTTDHGLSYPDIKAIFQDREGSHWIGTNGGGICQFNDKRFEFFGVKEGLHNDAVWSILEDSNGNYWFGTENGLSRYKPEHNRQGALNIKNYTTKNGLLGREVDEIYEDEKGILWLSIYDKGLQKFDPESEKFIPFPDVKDKHILCIVPDNRGNLWFGSNGGGIYRYNLSTGDVKNYNTSHGLSSNDVFSLLFADDGKLWITTRDGGVLSYDGKTFHRYGQEDGFNAITALSITKDLEGNIWIGSAGYGLYKYDGINFINYFIEHGLSGDDIYSLICDNDHNIWSGTRRGIEKYNILTGQTKYYDKHEGFLAVETNQNAIYKDSKGNLWFGTIEGVIRYNPKEDMINTVEPLIYIDNVSIFLGEYPLPPDRRFSYRRNHLTFNYVALSFVAPEKIRYQYKLEGLDQEWYPETVENYSRYANLSPGKYTFKVRAKNSDGIWSKEPATYHFEIITPFWRSTWFYLLLVLSLAVGVYGIHRRHLHNIEKDNIVLEAKVMDRTKQIAMEKEKAQNAYLAMRESEERYRKLIEMSPDAILVHSANVIEYVNKAGVKLFGASRKKDIIGKLILDIAHSDYIDTVRKRIQKIYKEKKKVKLMEQKMVRLDGSEFYVEVLGAPITYMGKDAAQTVIRDVTERKKAELALIQEKERLAVTLRSISDGVITTDINGKIMLMNERAYEITCCKKEEAIGKKFSQVVKILIENQVQNPIKQVLAKHRVLNYDNNTILKTNNGNKLYIEYSAAPIENSEGETIGVVNAFRDISAKKKMELELLKAQKLESIGLLAGGIAHDFNNILTAILGNISLAKLYTSEGEVSATLEKAEKASLQAKELTQQLLTFSKGGAPIKETASIFDIIKDSANFILRGSDIHCEFFSQNDLWTVDVDPGQMSQVIQNLIINAQQAMPQGKKITILLENMNLSDGEVPALNPGKYVKITLKDQGIGIPEKYLPRIFDPYFTTKKKGSGLGLATTYSIIKRHDGHITVSSKLGEGTSVEVYLPASIKVFTKIDQQEEFMHNGKGRILIMDDEEMVLDLVKQILDHLGYKVYCVEDGDKAIRQFRDAKSQNEPFDVVIMDLTIPGGLGGKEVIKTLKEIDPSVKAIVSSGYSNDPIMADYKKYGFAARLSKPYHIEKLSSTIQKVMLE